MSKFSAAKRAPVSRRGKPTEAGETLLPKRLALPVFASDALSSVAYAPDEIWIMLALAGMIGFTFSWPIAIAVAVVIVVVVASYRQTVRAYPNGGGDYEVAKANLGKAAGLTVASSLFVDYALTVAVSVSAGVSNAKAMLPWLSGYEVPAAVIVICCLMLVHLRGVRQFGSIFAVSTYVFVAAVVLMIAVGMFRNFVLGQPLASETADLEVVRQDGTSEAVGWVLIAILARSFASGAVALTGVEAISNGVPSFREPKSRNAATVLLQLAAMAIVMLLGIVALANLTKVRMIAELGGAYFVDPAGEQVKVSTTLLGQLARVVFADWFMPGFFLVITATVVILFLAANTAFHGFPSLASILARDGYLPRQLPTSGDRLAYFGGIAMLALSAIALVVAFNASVTALIQLYVVGVFISFTLGQAGMVRHWARTLPSKREARARRRARFSQAINAVGCLLCAIVLFVVLISKFVHGAYLAVVAIAVLYLLMYAISRHYGAVRKELALLPDSDRALPSRVRGVVLTQAVNLPTAKAIAFARATRPTTLSAVTVAVDDEEVEQLLDDWESEDFAIPLKVLASPQGEVTNAFIKYVAALRTENPRDLVSVFIPEYVVGHWWEQLLHNQTALLIRTRLHFMTGVMVISVPYQLNSSKQARSRVSAARRGYR